MSFLTPLYIAGLLAVSLPLVFHLIRRSPRGRFAFSSLMFLSPSPPRLTRRSRLDNLLLLLLRAAAIILLAFAFARPFLRQSAQLQFDPTQGRIMAVLLDTSASMQRENLWQQALAKAESVLDDLGPADSAALYTFDANATARVPFSRTPTADARKHRTALRAGLKALAPTSARSNLGEALIAVAEDLHHQGDAADTSTGTVRQIVLIGDVQEGGRTDALQSYQWPDDVQLAVHAVAPAATSNASLHPAAGSLRETGREEAPELRIRVANDRLSTVEQFQLHWESDNPPAEPAEPIDVHVPPGETRVVRVPRPSLDPATCRLVLSGDDHAFDNTLYLVSAKQEEVSVLYLGGDAPDDVEGLRYYLDRALPETHRRKVRVIAQAPGDPLPTGDLRDARLVVVGEAIPDDRADQLRSYVDNGGTLLYVLTNAAAGRSLGRIMGVDDLVTEEAPVDDYAMLAEIRFTHPLLAVFADPRFNDFTTIHFWKHRRVNLDGVPGVQVLARFDDGDPALFEHNRGKGKLLVLAGSWRPDDSQLARSTKFVPLLSGVLDSSGRSTAVRPLYEVGDQVTWGDVEIDSEPRTVRKPGGAVSRLARNARSFDETDVPGVYLLELGEMHQTLAVNLPLAESRTAPMDLGVLEELGVRLGSGPTRAELAETERQMRDVELEGRQKLWRWLIVAVLGVLITETWLAGYLSRKPVNTPEVTP